MTVFITGCTPRDGEIRLAVKDLFDTAGTRTTYGSVIFNDHVPATTATAVERLEENGYSSVGKANLHEFAYGVTSENPHFGIVPNPIAPGRTAGGSSGGCAAALSLRLADAALGTDSGGSIRIPSACCSTVGLKTTHGLVPLDGCYPLAPSYDTVGPMARDVEGCAAMMRVLAPDIPEHKPPALADLRVALAWIDDASPLVAARVAEAAALFTAPQPIDFPYDRVSQPVFMSEVANVHRDLFLANKDSYGSDLVRKLTRCLAVSDAELTDAELARAALKDAALELLEDFDLLLTPTVPAVAPPTRASEDEERRALLIANTYTFNSLGWPSLALPCGPAELGLPASLQLVGRPGSDTFLLAVGQALETALADRG